MTTAFMSDLSLCADRITIVIVSDMEVYILHSPLNPSLLNVDLIKPILVLYLIERWSTKDT